MITFNGITKRDNWECYSWTFNIKGTEFKYYTGIGHATRTNLFSKPKSIQNKKTIRLKGTGYIKGAGICHAVYVHVPRLKDLLYSLAQDADCAMESFEDFCSNLGYDTDSRKALQTYMDCQESGLKLRKIMKSKNYLERILAWEM